MVKSVNRSDLVRRIAGDLGLTIKQTQEIAEEAEQAIVKFVKEREQVRIHEFGTFYQTIMKSHVIKQIRTKTPRIVLEQKSVKFRPSPILKDAIYQRTRKPRIQAKKQQEDVQQQQVAIKRMPERKGNVTVNYKPTPIKPKPNITFKPLSIMPRVDSAEIQRKIKERLISTVKNQSVDPPKTQISREAEILIRLLGQIKRTGTKSLDFSFDKSKEIKIFTGRPRTQVSHLPREIIKGFLSYIDIEELHLPQVRHKLIFANSKGYDNINIAIHSFPTDSGASIHIELR